MASVVVEMPMESWLRGVDEVATSPQKGIDWSCGCFNAQSLVVT